VLVTADAVKVFETAEELKRPDGRPIYLLPCTNIVRVATRNAEPNVVVLTTRDGTPYIFKFALKEHANDWARAVGTPATTCGAANGYAAVLTRALTLTVSVASSRAVIEENEVTST